MYRVAIATGAVLVLATTVVVRPNLVNLLYGGAPDRSMTTLPKPPLPPNRDATTPRTPSAQKTDAPSLTFDVVSIDPEGTSVFAGQAPNNSSVSIQANGRVVATATADETGAWATVAERKLAAGEYEFTLSAQSQQYGLSAGPSVRMIVAPTSPHVSAKLETTGQQSIPAPITFVYNETTLTAEGQRAADLLAKYLIAQQPTGVSLSGHADERGSDLYNMELSRRRLSVVADYLRDRGFVGKLELIPKGRSEPYTAIDRNALPKEELFQLDRRVQLLGKR